MRWDKEKKKKKEKDDFMNTNDIWEVRVDVGRDTFRLLGFLNGRDWVILTNSFQKKTQKTPSQEIKLAERRKTEFLNRS